MSLEIWAVEVGELGLVLALLCGAGSTSNVFLEQDESYAFFIACLKKDSAFAPAFTSLGFFYLEHTSPPDNARASKCFQKAFELDATQTAAAQQLCRGFAEEQEWELVEVIARRTIEWEGGAGEGKEKVSARYLPANVWAWKAMGIVELVSWFNRCLGFNLTFRRSRLTGTTPRLYILSKWRCEPTLKTRSLGSVWARRTVEQENRRPLSKLYERHRSSTPKTGCATTSLATCSARSASTRKRSSLSALSWRRDQQSRACSCY